MARKRANGEGSILKRTFPRKSGGSYVRYYARITVGTDPATGKPTKQDGPLRKAQAEAKDDLKALTAAKEQKRLEPQRITVTTYLEYWFKTHSDDVRPRTRSTYDSLIRTHLAPRVGHHKLSDLSPLHCQELQRAVSKDVSPATARKCRQCLHAALEQAVRWELIMRNPLSLVKAIPSPRAELRKWTPKDAAAFLKAAQNDPYFALFYLVLDTGMRAGEVMGLMWDDLEGNVLRVKRQLATVGPPVFGPPKTRKSLRAFVLGPQTLAVLERHRKSQLARPGRGPNHDHGLIFSAINGQPLRLENLRDRHFNPIIEAAGVPKIRFHDLRHYHLSRLVELGLDLAKVSRRAGHSRNSTTLDIYVSTLDDGDEAPIILDELALEPEHQDSDEDEAA